MGLLEDLAVLAYRGGSVTVDYDNLVNNQTSKLVISISDININRSELQEIISKYTTKYQIVPEEYQNSYLIHVWMDDKDLFEYIDLDSKEQRKQLLDNLFTKRMFDILHVYPDLDVELYNNQIVIQ